MRVALTYLLSFISLLCISQSVTLSEIKVNQDLKVISDVKNDSIPHGRYLVRYKNHTLLKGTSNNGEMDGVWVSYYMNSQQKLKGRFINGKKHGEWTFWGKEGSVLAKFQYSHGKKIGHWEGFYESHKKAIDVVYNPNGEPLQCIQYYPSGIIALNFEYNYESQNTKSELSYYFENFNIFQYEQRTNNVLDGIFERYHDNNVLWESFTYSEGDLMRISETRSKGGMPRKNDDFRNGDGVLSHYYPNGNTFSKVHYKGGKKNGVIEVFDFGGKFSGSGEFNQNVPVGKWRILSKFHTQVLIIDFDSTSRLVHVNRKTSPAQKEHEEGTILDGYRHGKWQSFDAYGELLSTLNYKYGYLDGIQQYFQSNKLHRQFSFSNGNRSGKFTYYNTFGEILSEDIYLSKSFIDSNWYAPPITDWITVVDNESHTNNIKLNFYPPFPGLRMYSYHRSFYKQKEFMFLVQRSLGYNYWPELIPATFIGGYPAEKQFIFETIRVPDDLKSKKINGTVLLRYLVDEFGLISDITVLKSMGLGLDEIAVNVVKAFPPLNPATFNGIPIEGYVVREIDFKF